MARLKPRCYIHDAQQMLPNLAITGLDSDSRYRITRVGFVVVLVMVVVRVVGDITYSITASKMSMMSEQNHSKCQYQNYSFEVPECLFPLLQCPL